MNTKPNYVYNDTERVDLNNQFFVSMVTYHPNTGYNTVYFDECKVQSNVITCISDSKYRADISFQNVGTYTTFKKIGYKGTVIRNFFISNSALRLRARTSIFLKDAKQRG